MATVSTIRIGLADHGRTMTLDEFLEAEETEGFRYELARGVLEVTEDPNEPHTDIQWSLMRAVRNDDRVPGRIHETRGGAVMATTSTLKLGPADHGRRMTLEEFLDAETEEGHLYELARGVLEVGEIPDEPHGDIQWSLMKAISDHDRDHPGRIHRAGSGNSVRVCLPGLVSSRIPDVGVILGWTPRDARGQSPPRLVMEIVATGDEAHQRDYVTKREEYLRYGMLEYWIVDESVRQINALLRDGDTWVERVFRDQQPARGLVLPGFSVIPADL